MSRRWRVLANSLMLVALTVGGGHDVAAQAGATFLLIPFGARAVGRGEAVVADSSLGTEAVWWNPAAMTGMQKREFAFHNVKSVATNVFTLGAAVPSKKYGSFGVGAFMFDYGTNATTDGLNNVIGSVTSRSYLVAASYAAPVGSRASVGLTGKFVSFSQQCQGDCRAIPEAFGSSNALDVGAQYRLPDALRTTVGFSVRNVGQPLQVRDKEQADPLPRTIQFGARSRVPIPSLNERGATLDVSADISQVSGLDASFQSVGAVLAYKQLLSLSAGFKHIPGNGGGPSLGFTFQQGAFGIDISQRFDSFAASAGAAAPTYVALRVQF